MARASGIDDLFGHVPQAGELTLAAQPDEPATAPTLLIRVPPGGHTRDTIRVDLLGLIAFVRAAPTLPWDARDLRFYSGVVPYMAEWLKNGEGDALMAEFKAELDRLGAPDDQVAPNWRKLWAIAA